MDRRTIFAMCLLVIAGSAMAQGDPNKVITRQVSMTFDKLLSVVNTPAQFAAQIRAEYEVYSQGLDSAERTLE